MEFQNDIDFIIGYLTQRKTSDRPAEKINEVLLFIVNELKKISENLERK